MTLSKECKTKISKLLDEEGIIKLWNLKSDKNENIIKILRKSISLDADIRRDFFESFFVQAKDSQSILSEPEILLLRHIVFNGGVMTQNNFKLDTGMESKKIREAVLGLEGEENIIMTLVLKRNVKVLVLYSAGVRKYIKRNRF